MALTTILLSAAGEMGAGIGGVLVRGGKTRVLCCLNGRSEASQQRAKSQGITLVNSLEQGIAESDIILSILPPNKALEFAKTSVDAAAKINNTPLSEINQKKIYIDANAVQPETVKKISTLVSPVFRFVSASITGLPPTNKSYPKIYASCDRANIPARDEFKNLGDESGLIIKPLDNGLESASILKCGYAATTKGYTALIANNVFAAYDHSPETAQSLLQELCDSQPDLIKRSLKTLVTDMPRKAYRYEGEMNEISEFVGSAWKKHSSQSESKSDSSPEMIHKGFASIYEHVAQEMNKPDEGRVQILRKWANDAEQILNQKTDN